MMLCHYLSPEQILCPMQSESKQTLITELTTTLCERNELKSSDKILRAITAREKVSTTFLPVGIAMPHARCSSVHDIHMIMAITPEGLSEHYEGHECPLRVCCLFVSPDHENDFPKHIQLLARIATIFHDERRVQELSTARDGSQAFAMLQRFERETMEQQDGTHLRAAQL